jgi:hypothetical protein
MKNLFTILLVFITFCCYAQTTDTIKVVFLTAKKSVKYTTYTPAIIKGFIVYQKDSLTNGIELTGYLDDKKKLLKEKVIFSFVPVE